MVMLSHCVSLIVMGLVGGEGQRLSCPTLFS